MEDNNKKLVIYQAFPRWFGNNKPSPVKDGSLPSNGSGKFRDFTDEALAGIRELGTTHIWLTGIIEHATKTNYSVYGIKRDHSAVVKGNAGSPYAIKDYYDVDPDLSVNVYNRMNEFEASVEQIHRAGMKVIIDFAANHVARQYGSDSKLPYIEDLGQNDNTSNAFDPDNNFYYLPGQTLTLHFGAQQEDFEYSEFPAKVTGNDRFTATPDKNDWYETVKLNYGVDYLEGHKKYFSPIPNTWKKMLDILLFWSSKGVDGFRCDMAEMVPVEFWQWVIQKVKRQYPVIFIAEVYNPDLYRDYIHLGQFDYLYDKVGFYDTLRAVICGTKPASEISHCWQSTEDIQQHMLYFLENHDEQRIASDFFASDAKAGIPGMMVAAFMNTNPVMIYSAQELGERGMDEEGYSGRDGRTTIFDYWSLKTLRDWNNNGKFNEDHLDDLEKEIRHAYCELLTLACEEKAFTEGKFYDLMYANENNPSFDAKTIYAFLRKKDNDVVLVVVNFSKEDKTVDVIIPENAFSVLGFRDNQAAYLKDLLSGEEFIGTLTEACPYRLSVPKQNGRVIQFNLV
jgi:glycosidase